MNEFTQLLLPALRWSSTGGFADSRELIDRSLETGVGGFIIFGGRATEVTELTAELRERSGFPLLIGSDLERGAGQQFSGATGLPPLAAIAWLEDTAAIRRAARLTAVEARSLGVNWVYAPVCDLDLEPANPIIGTRSLGSDPNGVASAAAIWIEACQAAGALACAKHFPGHGRTTGDSHAELPVVDAGAELIEQTDLVPFHAAVNAGVASVMTAHVAYPALDSSAVPATLSAPILRGILREKLGFEGLIVTDALIMEGVLGGGEEAAVVKALAAGCDLLLYPSDIERCAEAIRQAVETGALARDDVNRSLARRRRWAEHVAVSWVSPTLPPEDVAWAEELCERVVHSVRGSVPHPGAAIDLIVVDDDVGGPYPPPSRQTLSAELESGGIAVHPRHSPSGSADSLVLIALFGDIRAWKGRPGYSADSLERVALAVSEAEEAGQEHVVVQFSHPRLAGGMPGSSAVICAWGGEEAMQRAAARTLIRGRKL